jgi:hypothetical protein
MVWLAVRLMLETGSAPVVSGCVKRGDSPLGLESSVVSDAPIRQMAIIPFDGARLEHGRMA